MEAKDLKLRDQLKLKDNRIASVTGFLIRSEKTKVYNLKVLRLRNYSVASFGVLVHNSPPKCNDNEWDDLMDEDHQTRQFDPKKQGDNTVANKQVDDAVTKHDLTPDERAKLHDQITKKNNLDDGEVVSESVINDLAQEIKNNRSN